MKRILIADDHAIVRRGLKDILLEGFPHADVSESDNAEDLIKKVMKETWDVVITDLSMPGRSGLEALQQIRQLYPKLPVLVLSVYPEEQYAIRVLKAGASGYLNKDLAPDALIKAVERVCSGKKYISPAVAEKLAQSLETDGRLPHETLSDREFEVLKLLATGKSVSEIALSFHLGVTTISTYRARILTKLDLKTNADLTQYALQHGLM